jgi:hypothetical protein
VRSPTPPSRASLGLGLPHAEVDQAELRRQRRARHLHVYGPDFSLVTEVEQVCSSLAVRVMLRPVPAFYLDEVTAVADAVYFTASRLTATIARARAARHAAALPIEVRGRELKRIADEAGRRVPRPVITANDLRSGTWVSVLTALVRRQAAPLSALLGSPEPGSRTVSEQLEGLLRLVDDAAAGLHRKLKAAEDSPAVDAPAHVDPVTQEQCRAARRAKMPFDWPAEFDLSAEIAAICQPLADAVAAADDPAKLAASVNQLAQAVCDSVAEVADLVGRADAWRRCADLPVMERGRALRLIKELAPRPPRLSATAAGCRSGGWAAALAETAAPYSSSLAALLADSVVVGGQPVSATLETALAAIDSAALALERRIGTAGCRGARPPKPAQTAPPQDKATAARAELARLGVTPPP